MTKAEIRAIYDDMASTFLDAVRSFTVVIDATTTLTGSGINANSATMRHLFSGGPGQRYTSNLIARTDRFLDQAGAAAPEEGLADRLTGMICTIGSTDYRVMAANPTPCGGLIRIALDSVEQVGV
jgi:hypothetical protein